MTIDLVQQDLLTRRHQELSFTTTQLEDRIPREHGCDTRFSKNYL